MFFLAQACKSSGLITKVRQDELKNGGHKIILDIPLEHSNE